MEDVYQRIESNVRSYCRSWPTSFMKARLHEVYDESGRAYIDFFAGAGALNYGHNNPLLKQAVIDYLNDDGIVHSLDMHTTAKRRFLEAFESILLTRLADRYKVMFTGPTGADAVEAAIRLAKKVTGRRVIAAFVGGYHGMTAGALSLSYKWHSRNSKWSRSQGDTVFLPYDATQGKVPDDIRAVEAALDSLAEPPAGIVIETIQAEGGVIIARDQWLRNLAQVCQARGILFILDDVQMGCGRTGPFFSSELAGLRPDFIVLSKSLGAFGVPLSTVLFKAEMDAWSPGEHTGTFRGQNLAFVAGQAALEHYWLDRRFEKETEAKGVFISQHLHHFRSQWPSLVHSTRGKGLIFGIEFTSGEQATNVANTAFANGLLIERVGVDRKVLKLAPPLNICQDGLDRGMAILADSVRACTDESTPAQQH